MPRFAELFESDPDDPAFVAFRRAEAIGGPLGSAAFAADLAARLGRPVLPRKRGRKPKDTTGEWGDCHCNSAIPVIPFAGLLAEIAWGHFTASDRVVLIHTGGTPALFAYADEFLQPEFP